MYCLVNIPDFILKEEYVKNRPLKDLGNNSGNCLFWESTKNILRGQNLNLLSINEYNKNRAHYQKRISKVVFCFANLINDYAAESMHQGWIANIKMWIDDSLKVLSPLHCDKYLICIGAQSHDLLPFKFEKDQKESLRKLLSQFKIVYLRGQYTYDVLKYNETLFQNMTCVGCPSLLLRPIDLDGLRSKIDLIRKRSARKIQVGISMGGMSGRKDITSDFMNLIFDRTVHVLMQGGNKKNFLGKELFFSPYETPRSIRFFTHFFVFLLRAKRNLRKFVYSDNYSELIEYFENNVDCLITTRIHATILGILSGVPSLCIVTDSRTYELCEQMGIPYVNCIGKPIPFKNKKDLIKIFVDNCAYTDKIHETVKDMREKYAAISHDI